MSRIVSWDRRETRGRRDRGRRVTRSYSDRDNGGLVLVKTDPSENNNALIHYSSSSSSMMDSSVLKDLRSDSIEIFLFFVRTYPWLLDTREKRRDLLHDSIYYELKDLVERYLHHPRTSEQHRFLDIEEWMSPDIWSTQTFHDVLRMALLPLESAQKREERIQKLSQIRMEQPFTGFNLHVVLEFCGKVRNRIHAGADKGLTVADRRWIIKQWIANLSLRQERHGENYLQRQMRLWLDEQEQRERDRKEASTSSLRMIEIEDDDIFTFKGFVEELRAAGVRKNEEVKEVFAGLHQSREYYFLPNEGNKRSSRMLSDDYSRSSYHDSRGRKRARYDDKYFIDERID